MDGYFDQNSIKHSPQIAVYGKTGRHLLQFLKENQSKIIDFAEITWRFIPAYTPHWGGLWEANIKAMKSHLYTVVKTTDTLNFDEARTLISQIEAILNSRPLTPESSDLNALTPGHFLIGGPLTALPNTNQVAATAGTPTRVKQWKLMQKLTQQFWKRWSSDYLNTLHQRTKRKILKDDLKVGDFVLIKERNLPPTHWCMGRISQVFPGRDKKVSFSLPFSRFVDANQQFFKTSIRKREIEELINYRIKIYSKLELELKKNADNRKGGEPQNEEEDLNSSSDSNSSDIEHVNLNLKFLRTLQADVNMTGGDGNLCRLSLRDGIPGGGGRGKLSKNRYLALLPSEGPELQARVDGRSHIVSVRILDVGRSGNLTKLTRENFRIYLYLWA